MMTATQPKIAFLKQGAFSHINQNIEKILRARFPEHSVHVIDIENLLRQNHKMKAANIPWFVREHGFSLRDSLTQHRKNFYRTTYLFRQLKRLVNKIVGTGDYLFSFQTQSLLDLSTPGIPHYVYTDHAILSNLAYPNVTRAYIDAHYTPQLLSLERTIYHNATMVFTMGNFVAQTLIKQYGCSPDLVAAVGGGSNLPATEELLLGDTVSLQKYSAKNVLFLGVVWGRKGGPALLEAFRDVRGRHPSATLTIVGCTPDVHLDGCNVVGPVPLADVQSYYNQASIFCMPSLREPFGIAYVEALMNRLPVVATTVGAIPDIVCHGKSGLLVEPNDHDGLVHALDALLSNSATCHSYGDFGYNFVRKKYTWDAVGDTLYHHIQATLS